MEGSTKDQTMSSFGLIWRGFAMGIAEIIPGVSGGTIAFITGIYERLIKIISSLSPALISILFKEGIKPFWRALDGNFLLMILIGMLAGIGIGIFGVTYLLEHAPAALWSFFFGLIAASVIYMMNQTNTSKSLTWVLFVTSTIISYTIVSTTPLTGSTDLLYVFLCGIIAFSALILPGISGSYVLLILGMYTIIYPEMKALMTDFSMYSFKLVLSFLLGGLTGIILFSKIVKYTFENYRNGTLSILSGIMLGSLVKIWPWRNPTLVLDKTTGNTISIDAYKQDILNDNYKLVLEENVLPEQYFSDPMTLISIIVMLIGFSIVIWMMIKSKPQS